MGQIRMTSASVINLTVLKRRLSEHIVRHPWTQLTGLVIGRGFQADSVYANERAAYKHTHLTTECNMAGAKCECSIQHLGLYQTIICQLK